MSMSSEDSDIKCYPSQARRLHLEKCYICLGRNSPLVSHCTRCVAVVHQECIDTQVANNLHACGNCGNQLELDTYEKREWNCISKNACRNWYKLSIFVSFVSEQVQTVRCREVDSNQVALDITKN